MSRFELSYRVTWWSLIINLAFGVVKCTVGYLAHSKALIADGIHSLSDLATDVAVLLGLRFAEIPKDENHPYGHHKIASLATLFIALAILGLCVGLIAGSLKMLATGEYRTPMLPALIVALFSLGAKEFLFRWTKRTARPTKSRLLLANAWHHRSDSVSSLAAAIGIGCAYFGGEALAFFDVLVGILLGAYLAVEGGKALRRGLHDLLDAAPEQPLIDDLREHILPTPGALSYHAFRARRLGDMIDVDLHLLVDPEKTVKEGHAIAWRVRKNILARHPEVLDVLVHIEPAVPEQEKEEGVHGKRDEDAAREGLGAAPQAPPDT